MWIYNDKEYNEEDKEAKADAQEEQVKSRRRWEICREEDKETVEEDKE